MSAIKTGDKVLIEAIGGEDGGFCVRGDDREFYAFDTELRPWSDRHSASDARLSAAAPDLLAALVKMTALVEEHVALTRDERDDVTAAHAAIAKAGTP